MKWVTYRRPDGSTNPGLVIDDQIFGLSTTTSMLELLGDDGERLAAAAESARTDPGEVLPFTGTDLDAPIRPPQIRDFLTFLQHLRNARAAVSDDTGDLDQAWHEIPAFYFTNAAAVTGPYDEIPISPGSEMFDFELEVAAIIGRAGANLHPDRADQHIVGFSIFCDWSARDLQRHEMKLTLGPAKGKDGANSLGPMLVTIDELAPRRAGNSYDLGMRAFINDELVTDGSMSQMDWTWGEIVAYASRGTTLQPGDAIGSGTVPMGCLAEHFATTPTDQFRGWLTPGDEVRLEVDLLGTTRFTVSPAPPVHRLRTGF